MNQKIQIIALIIAILAVAGVGYGFLTGQDETDPAENPTLATAENNNATDTSTENSPQNSQASSEASADNSDADADTSDSVQVSNSEASDKNTAAANSFSTNEDTKTPDAPAETPKPSAQGSTSAPSETSAPANTSNRPDTPAPTETATSPEVTDQSEPAEKNTAPDFYALNSSESKVYLSSYFGKPIVINFWATWCGPCRAELPDFDAAYAAYGDKVTFMMVNLTDGSNDTISSVKEFVSDNGFSFPVYFDTEYSGAAAYGIQYIPVTIFIDKNGNVHNVVGGKTDKATLEKTINEML